MSSKRRDPLRWWALAALGLSVLLVSVDNTILALAIPSLSEDLDPTPTELLWIGDIYSFVLAGLLITMGNVGDRIGRKRLLMIGLVAFALLSVVAAFSPTAQALIVSRAALGVAGATLMPSTLSLIRNTFHDNKERTFAVGVWAAMAAAGAGLGPILGGVLLEHFWWGSVLLVNVPIVILIIAIGFWSLRESKNPNPGPIDMLSVALSLVGMLATIAGIKEIAFSGIRDYPGWLALAVGLAAMTWFVRRQLHLEHPLIEIRLFKIPAFTGAVLADLISVFGLIGVYFFLAQQFQLVDGDSPLRAGFQLLPAEIAAIIGSGVAALIIGRFGGRFAISGGITMGAAGLFCLGVTNISGTLTVSLSMALVGLGFGVSLTGTADAILTAAPPERAGAASAVSETAYELGAALGIALLGTVLGTTYRSTIELPPNLPPDVSAAASESLTAVFQEQGQWSESVAEPVLAAARVAFTDALSLTCIVAAFICILGAGVAYRVIPSRGEVREESAKH